MNNRYRKCSPAHKIHIKKKFGLLHKFSLYSRLHVEVAATAEAPQSQVPLFTKHNKTLSQLQSVISLTH